MPAKWWVMIFRFGWVSMILEYHEPQQGAGSLVGPADGPPDLVKRLVLDRRVVRRLGAARRMQPDRRAELVHLFPERRVFGPVERLAGDIGVDLHAERAVFERTLRLGGAGIGRRQRDLRHP